MKSRSHENAAIRLLQKGAILPLPETVTIEGDVPIDRLSGKGVVIHPGCRLRGEKTMILEGAKLGAEGPVTVENCYIGPGVELRGGYFRDAVFLEGAVCGSGSHVREGTILEERASIAHTVGLKQTILFPFVTLGSLINFCDCLMAGGTGPENHSEVGSSYIHFNFTPRQDKATPSLIGDVPRGVMLNQKPIFLGGQGGMVGPLRLNFGTTVAAGTILRKDELRPDRMIFGGTVREGNVSARGLRLGGSARVIENNVFYLANLAALRLWYIEARALFISGRFPEELHAGLLQTLESGIAERLKRLRQYLEIADKREPLGRWPEFEAMFQKILERRGDPALRERFLEALSSRIDEAGKEYTKAIQALASEEAAIGTSWLQGLVDETVGALQRILL
ncbi:MAG: protein GlmU [Desulfobacterales bacterium]